MNFKTTLILLLLVLLGGAYFFLFEIKRPTTNEIRDQQLAEDQPDGALVFSKEQLPVRTIKGDPDPAGIPDVDSFTIETRDGKSELVRENNGWKQIQPVRFAISEGSPEQDILLPVASLRFNRKFTPGKGAPALNELGLDPPQATLSLTVGGAKPGKINIKVGQTALGGHAYITVDGRPDVYVVPDTLRKALIDKQPEEWRRRSLTTPSPKRTSEITLTRGGYSLDLVHNSKGWSFGPPDSGRVASDSARTMISSLATVHIDKFVADAPADLSIYGLDEPPLIITLRSTPPPPSVIVPEEMSDNPDAEPPPPAPAATTQPSKVMVQSLRIGAPADIAGDSFFATWSDADEPGNVVFTILKADRERLDKGINDFRDPRLTDFKQSDIQQISIEHPGVKIGIERSGKTGWQFSDPAPGFKADPDAVTQLLDSLTLTRAESFVAKVKPTGSSLATLSVWAPGRLDPDVIRIFPGDETQGGARIGSSDQRLVMRNDETTGLLVPEERLAWLFAPVVSLRDRTVIDVKPAEIRAIKLVRGGLPADTPQVSLTRSKAATPTTRPAGEAAYWKLEGTSDSLDGSSLDALLTSVAPLHAEAWFNVEKLSETDEKAVIDLEIITVDGKTRTAKIYPEAHVGTIPEVNAQFRVNRLVAEALAAEFRNRTLVGIDVDSLKRITVTDRPANINQPASLLTINRDDLGVYSSASGPRVSQSSSGFLFTTLSSLRAEHYTTPANIALDGPGRTLDLESKDGRKIRIFLPESLMLVTTISVTVQGGPTKWCTISAEAAQKLRTDLLDRENPAKPSMQSMPSPLNGMP